MTRALVAALAALMLALPARAAAIDCPDGAQCHTIAVPLDHSGKVAGTLPLAYARVPAREARTGTLVFLSGGPGQSAIPLTRDVTSVLRPVNRHYDFVFVDQRGTGDSGAVKCDSTAGCATALGDRRAFFSTAETAEDLENLRAALGVDKLTLLGTSYGTKVAQEYVRRFPAQTAAVILDSPTPVDGLDGVAVLPELGTPRVLRETCYPGPCSDTVRDPVAALRAAVARMQTGTVKGPLVNRRGHVRTARVSEHDLYDALTASDLDPLLRNALPAAIASLAHGDAAPFLHMEAINASGPGTDDSGINLARLLATTCIEGRLPWAPDSPLAGRQDALTAYMATHADAYSPFSASVVLGESAAAPCIDWPPTPAPAPAPSPAPNVPMLILSGRDDLRTPTEDARRTLAEYPGAKLLTVRDVGHSVLGSDLSGCALAGTVAFLAGQPVEQCPKQPSRFAGFASITGTASAYLPPDVDDLRPTGLPGLAGRTLDGFVLTLTALGNDLLPLFEKLFAGSGKTSLPGLRGGYTTFDVRGLHLHDVEVFRGLRVSGGGSDTPLTFTISGPKAANGTLVLSDNGLDGTLGGHAFHIHGHEADELSIQ